MRTWIAAPTLAAGASLIALSAVLAMATDASEPTSVWDGIYTLEQAQRGEPLYEQGCAECHGPALEGDDMSPPLIGSDFLWDWDGTTVADMFERLRLSMPDGDANSMTTQEKADVLAFVLLKNEFPAGERELANNAKALTGIAFEAVRP